MSEVRAKKTASVIRQKLLPSDSQLNLIDKALERGLHKALAQSASQLLNLNLQISDHSIFYEDYSGISNLTKPLFIIDLVENSTWKLMIVVCPRLFWKLVDFTH